MGIFQSLMQELAQGRRAAYFPDGLEPNEHGLVALGGRLSVEIVLEAYSKSYFPWTGEHPIPWFSPDPRLVLFPRDFYASRSLRKLTRQRRYTVRFDHDFRAVIEACAAPRPYEPETWITSNIRSVYTQLHELHLAHSVEVYDGEQLCGGLYGLSLGRAFFGESMFSWQPNTSKLALYRLSQALTARQFDFIDCQQETPHLASLGAVPISRAAYLERLQETLQHPTWEQPWCDWGDDFTP